MSLALTDAAERASLQVNVRPQLVLEIDEVDTLFATDSPLAYIRVGDPDLLVGGDAPNLTPLRPWVIGGLGGVGDSVNLISMDGSGSTISQQLYRDKGSVSSVPTLKVKLVDQGNLLSELISPGVIVDDLLGRKAKVRFGFQGTGYPEDFIEIFRGSIDEIESGAGDITLNLAHPDQKKRQELFNKLTMKLTTAMTTLTASVPIVDADEIFLSRVNGPDGVYDPTITYYVRIDDEIIKYETANSLGLQTITRAQLGTVAANHAIDTDVETFYVIESDLIDLALRLMISGTNGYYATDLPVESFNLTNGDVTVPNSLFFEDIDVQRDYNLQVGDFVTISGSGVGANNQTLVEVTQIIVLGNGSYVVVAASPDLADEAGSSAIVSLRSQYDSWGQGLAMDPRDIDIEEHWRWQDLILFQYELRIYIKDMVQGKEFLEKEIYAPYGAYAIPRKGLASVGYHIGPIPTIDLTFIDRSNVVNPNKIRLKRSQARNFYNTIVYQFDQDSIDDKFLGGVVYVDEDSKTRIPVGTKAFVLPAKGIRSDLEALANTENVSRRLLERYKFAAEYFEAIEVFFKTGFNLDPGDLVVFDPTGLKVTNTTDGTRIKPSRFFEVQNKSMDLKTGKISLSLLDTSFSLNERYGLISPSSVIETGGDTGFVIIEDSYGGVFPGEEFRKWENYIGLPVLVHNEDYSFSEEVIFTGFSVTNPFRMNFDAATPLSIPAVAGWVIDIPYYPATTDKEENREYKLIHAHQAPIVAVVSGASDTEFDVDVADIGKFFVGAPIIVHNATFSQASTEVKVLSILGTTITVNGSLGFTPSSSDFASLLGFADSEPCYRYI